MEILMTLTKQVFSELISTPSNTCVSLYMPSFPAGREQRQNQIRFKNLVVDAEDLLSKEPNADEADHLSKALTMISEDPQHEMWHHPSEGLAVFATPEGVQFHHLPTSVKEQVHVGERFYLKPLLPLLQSNGRYFVIAVSQNRVRMFEGTRSTLREMQADGLPSSLEDALNIDEYLTTLQSHGFKRRGNTEAIFHGHGGGDNDDALLVQYFHRLDDALEKFLTGHDEPLVYAGVGSHFHSFKECINYRHLLDEPVEGNFDDSSLESLHEEVWKVVESHFNQRAEDAVAAFADGHGNDRVCSDLTPLLRAASRGAVETLLLRASASCWGQLDVDGNVVIHDEPREMSLDLLDEAAFETLQNSGTVLVLEDNQFPGNNGSCAALLRYPVKAATAAAK